MTNIDSILREDIKIMSLLKLMIKNLLILYTNIYLKGDVLYIWKNIEVIDFTIVCDFAKITK